jgi:sugar phosphate permease
MKPNIAEIQLGRQRGWYAYSWSMLGLVWTAYFVDIFMRYNIPTVIPVLMKEYGWSAVTVGWVDSAYLWSYALMQVPWGYISERWLGPRWTITIGTALIAVSSVMFAFHIQDVFWGVVARAFIGAGSAAVWVPANPSLARWFAPNKRGLTVGILATGGKFGTLLGGALMPFLVSGAFLLPSLSNIQSGFMLSAIPGVLIVLLVPMILRDRPEEMGLESLDRAPGAPTESLSAQDEPTFGYIMTHSIYPYVIAVVYAGYLGALYFVSTWFALYLSREYRLNVKDAGLLWAFGVATPAFISQPVSGWLSDWIGRKRSVSFALLCTSALAMVFVVVAALRSKIPLPITIVLIILFSLFEAMWVMVWPFTTLMFPTKAGGPIGGFMNTAAQLVGAAAPVISGYLLHYTGSFSWVFALGALCPFIGFLASLMLKENRVV